VPSPIRLAKILSMRCQDQPIQSMTIAIEYRTASLTNQQPRPARGKNHSNLLSILPRSSRVTSCVSPICPNYALRRRGRPAPVFRDGRGSQPSPTRIRFSKPLTDTPCCAGWQPLWTAGSKLPGRSSRPKGFVSIYDTVRFSRRQAANSGPINADCASLNSAAGFVV